MAWTYQTEYQLGSRGLRVTRNHGGLRALVAIGTDLTLALIFGAFGLVFWLVGWSLWLAWHLSRLVVIACRDVVVTLARLVKDLLTLPWRVTRPALWGRSAKPSLASFDEF